MPFVTNRERGLDAMGRSIAGEVRPALIVGGLAGKGSGPLNLYTRQSSGFDDAAAVRVSTFAAHAAIALAKGVRGRPPTQRESQPGHAFAGHH
jgi:hypothetical protein